ncbi:similar to testes development-related NYD-SP22 isoform 1 (predicted), isoform CRA_b [Rattus norvegicus]|uniref:Similar to testes development-related NYD-SP22 isoform 1 (Predicted), isoform CRA_b n=2 Tax=Rattus norvegicus TaxID=10116 RepID=A6IIV6_RAT|nr:similar to testes development-related NYD-SP22 isoform 1 (predicted), isoform CRA_b [Rattus norvegicus]
MESEVRGMPLEYPPKPERLNAYDCTPLRVCGPSAGTTAVPRIRKPLLWTPLLSARDGLLHHWGA